MESESEQEQRYDDDDDNDANADLTLDIIARANKRRKSSQQVEDEIEAERQQNQLMLKTRIKPAEKRKKSKRKHAELDLNLDGGGHRQEIVDQRGKTFVVEGRGSSMSDPLFIFEQTESPPKRKRRKSKVFQDKGEKPSIESARVFMDKTPQSEITSPMDDEPAFIAAEEPSEEPQVEAEPGTPDVVTTEVVVKEQSEEKPRSRFRRYFDPPPGEDDNMFYEACFNCGETGHYASTCTAVRRRKPCYVCGETTHEGWSCPQKSECYICNEPGHLAKQCPLKGKGHKAIKRQCLHCGDQRHDVTSCSKAYDPDDLKAVQCYVCQRFGHLCCSDGLESFPRQASCYNCGNTGHTGVGCMKSRDGSTKGNATQCFKCGGEGHFARGCSQGKWPGTWDEMEEFDFPRGPQRDESRGRQRDGGNFSRGPQRDESRGPQRDESRGPQRDESRGPQRENGRGPQRFRERSQGPQRFRERSDGPSSDPEPRPNNNGHKFADDFPRTPNVRPRKWHGNGGDDRRGNFHQRGKTKTMS